VANRYANFSNLSTYTRIAATSGSLAKHNIFEMGAGLLAKVKEKEETAERKKQRINTKTIKREQKGSEKFISALAKYKSGRNLTREDVLALINRTKHSSDEANGKTLK
jgi:hypothetical protein